MKILGVIGSRPQIIKADPELLDVVVNTSQHYDDEMAGQHFRDRKIKPKYNLGLDSGHKGEMVDCLQPILEKEKPDIVVVYGDTFSTMAGTLAAAYNATPIAHVEAGLRSYDMAMPEEVNRITADRLATWRFCPTVESYNNLTAEGLGLNSFVVGDSLFDTMKPYLPLKKMKDYQQFAFCSIHRRENLTELNLSEIMDGLGRLPRKTVFPIHPHTHRIIKKFGIKIPKNVEVKKPMSRRDTLTHVSNCRYVVTDSGGLQREAYWMTKHSYIIRPVTEWTNIVASGWATLLPANAEVIAREAEVIREHLTTPEVSKISGADARIRRILREEK